MIGNSLAIYSQQMSFSTIYVHMFRILVCQLRLYKGYDVGTVNYSTQKNKRSFKENSNNLYISQLLNSPVFYNNPIVHF